MKEQVHWNDFVSALDYTTTHKTTHSVLSWQSWEQDPSGVSFQCQTALGKSAQVRIDIIDPAVIRFRLNPDQINQGPSEILLTQEFPAVKFTVKEQPSLLEIETERLLIRLPQKPWGMQIYDKKTPEKVEPFFAQQTTDRAYGPGFEVPPVGFKERDGGLYEVRETVAVQPGESFYGFGERFSSLDKWGQELEFWAVDSGNVTSNRAYKNIPFFISSAGYGLYINSSFPMVFRMGSESNVSYSFHILDQQLDYFLICGPAYKDILKTYADLTGYAPIPPKWSFGFWISRCMYMSREEGEAVVNGMREHDFPCDVISFDPYWMGEGPWCTYEWDETVFPDPVEMMASFRKQGIRTCLWLTAYLPEGTPRYEEAAAKGYLIKDLEGNPAPVLEAFTGSSLAAVDFTNPEAVSWWQGILRSLLEMGAATFKTDFAEQAPIDAIYADGRTGLEMHNLYPLLYNRTAFELTKEYFGRGLVWGRSAYAGSQRYPVQWGGDSYSSFGQIVGQLRGLLGYGLSGVPFCSHDIGGFDYSPEAFDTDSLDDFPKDALVYLRWLQFGAFSSHMRAHGKQPREPWEYGDQVESIARDFLKLRYRLLPYIYSQAVLSSQNGLPMVRPMLLEYQDDPNTRSLDLQYLFGSDFLVAPVLNRDPARDVYLPDGEWFNYWTKESISGPGWITVKTPLDEMPLWVKGGSVIPYGPEMLYVDQLSLKPLTLEFYGPGGTTSLVIYDEDQDPIEIKSVLEQGILKVEINDAPNIVEICCFGVDVTGIELNGVNLELEKIDAGVLAVSRR